MAGLFVSVGNGSAALTTDNSSSTPPWKTLLSIAAPSNHRLLLRKFFVGFEASSGKAVDIVVAKISAAPGGGRAIPGTAGHRDLLDSDASETPQATYTLAKNDTDNDSEGTVNDIVERASISPQSGGWTWRGGALPIKGGEILGILVHFPESGAVPADVQAVVEE